MDELWARFEEAFRFAPEDREEQDLWLKAHRYVWDPSGEALRKFAELVRDELSRWHGGYQMSGDDWFCVWSSSPDGDPRPNMFSALKVMRQADVRRPVDFIAKFMVLSHRTRPVMSRDVQLCEVRLRNMRTRADKLEAGARRSR